MHKDYLKAIQQYIAPKYGLSLYAGFWANLKIKKIKNRLIRNFIKKYKVNMQEAVRENVDEYSCFNDFFTRHLKPQCRPIATNCLISPVDGSVSEFGDIQAGQLIQAKGKYYSSTELLAADANLAKEFLDGAFITLYLSPKDYHRIHMPISGTLRQMTYIPGQLFSVQPTTVNMIPNLFARNERVVSIFDTDIGPMAIVLVGAVIVGSIGTSWHGDLKRARKITSFSYGQENSSSVFLKKAEEMGYFKLGSTVILLFSDKSKINWSYDLKYRQPINFGECIANFT